MSTEHDVTTPTSEDAKRVATPEADLLYVHAATSDNTRRAYQADIADFLKKGGALPSSSKQIRIYLQNGFVKTESQSQPAASCIMTGFQRAGV